MTRSTKQKTRVELIREIVGASRACEVALVPHPALSLMQFHILDRLASHPDGLHQKHLVSAQETGRSSGVSTSLKKMEYELEWLVREIDRNDRRTFFVKLTAKGKAVLDEARPTYLAALESALKDFSQEEIDTLHSGLRKIRKLLDSTLQDETDDVSE
jgi:DNA-binding MarR family transcriptional regulator